MRRAGRIDANQPEIVAALRRMGASVLSLAGIGHGAPDLLVGFAGRDCLLEVKDGSKAPSKRTLTLLERDFIDTWRGHTITVVESAAEAVAVVSGQRLK